MAMENEHDMHIPKDNCPFIVADSVICNTLTKRENNILNTGLLTEIDLSYNYNYISINVVIALLYFLLFYIFFVLKRKSSSLSPILLQELFSNGILNGKAY